LQALPPEFQAEYRDEVEKARKKKEAEQHKQQEAERRRQQAEEARKRDEADRERWAQLLAEQARRHRELEAEQARRRESAERERQTAETNWNAKVNAATNVVPEEQAITDRYPALDSIATVIKVITVIIITRCQVSIATS
jgi:hypothetical protein